MKIKNIVSVIAAIGLAVAGSIFANAEGLDIRLDENGRVIREYSSEDIQPELRSSTEEIVTQHRLVPIADTAEDENKAELMSDGELIAYEIEKCVILLSENSAELTVRLSEFYDAKYKLTAMLVDRNGNVVATQTNCEYDFTNRWNSQLVYTLEYVPGFELNTSENYFVRFRYSGDFEFINSTGNVGFMVNDDPYLKSGEIVNADEKKFKFHVANYNPNYTYSFEIGNVKYEPTAVSDGYLYVTAEEFDIDSYGNSNIYVSLWADNGNFEQFCGSIELLFFVYGDYNPDGYFHGLYLEPAAGLNTRKIFIDLYNKENGAVYTAQDVSNLNIYMLDTVTGANIGTTTLVHDSENNYISAKITLGTALTENRNYLVVIDDGYTIRTAIITAYSKPGFSFCGIDDGTGSYDSYDIPDRQNYSGMIFDAFNISDLSKLNIFILDTDGNAVVTMDAGSAVYRTTDWADNLITFTMTRKSAVNYDDIYSFVATYDGELIYENECCFYPSYGQSSSYFIDGYITDSFATDTHTYILFAHHVEGFNEALLQFALYSRADGQKRFGTVDRTLYEDGWYKYSILKFNHVLPDGNYGEWQLLVCDESGGTVYREEGYNIHTVTLPYMYGNSYTDNNGNVHMYGEGIPAGNHKIVTFDTAQNKVVSFPLTYVGTKGELTVPHEKLSSVSPLNDVYYIECDGKLLAEIDAWEFRVDFLPDNAFYVKYRNITHRFAQLCLPFGEYTQYRVSEDRDALASAPFNAMKRNIIFTLSEGDGKKTIYGQFKKADGTVSEIMTTTVNSDSSAPVLTNFEGLPGNLVKENNYVILEFSFNSTENGNLFLEFYDANGNLIGDYAHIIDMSAGRNEKYLDFYCWEGEDFSQTKKIVITASDNAGNISETYEFDMTVIELYTNVDVPGGYLILNNQTGYIESAEIYATELKIPTAANGITIVGIEAFAFEGCYNIAKVTIPATVTYISDYAFYGLDIDEIVGREGSAAEDFANRNYIDFEIQAIESGDVTGDGELNSRDLLALAKHFSGWQIDIYTPAADVTGDGLLNLQDLLRLAKYIAGWNVPLG